MLPEVEEHINLYKYAYWLSQPQEYYCVNRSPDFASSYFGVFPSLDSDFLPFRQLHGYWDSPEFSSVFPWHLYDTSTFVHKHKLFICL
jgi:hypothetical protein